MKIFILFISILTASSAYAEYDATGIRDPMVKFMPKKIEIVPKTKKIAQVRQKEIFKIIKKCAIEGVVISNSRRLALINDRLLAEGDRILPDYDVIIYKIDYKYIKFSLDGQIVTYPLSITK